MLISTIITATSALTAIVGGFLVSRVITMASEKNAIIRRLREIENEINSKEEMFEQVEDILFEEDLDSFIEEYAEEILIEGKAVETILEENDPPQLTGDELKPHIEKLRSIYKHLINAIADQYDKKADYVLPTEYDTFARDANIKVNKKQWYEKAYTLILTNITQATQSSVTDLITGRTSIIDLQFPTGINTKYYMDKVKDRDKLKNEIIILSGMKNELTKHLNEYGNIQGLWSGLGVLFYACFAGIFFPGMLLIYPKQVVRILNISSDLIVKHILVYLFFSGLAAIIIYLGVSMFRLTKTD